jgi:hypothetical protein
MFKYEGTSVEIAALDIGSGHNLREPVAVLLRGIDTGKYLDGGRWKQLHDLEAEDEDELFRIVEDMIYERCLVSGLTPQIALDLTRNHARAMFNEARSGRRQDPRVGAGFSDGRAAACSPCRY